MKESAIEWTNDTWNPWHGCKKVSAGCRNCYMYRDKKRWGQDGSIIQKAAEGTFYAPYRLKGPYVFTCSWSDFFIEEADAWRPEAWKIIKETPHLTYQILTKRPELIKDRLPDDWGRGYPNVWLGTSVESQEHIARAWKILCLPAARRFLSCEPLLGPVNLDEAELLCETWRRGATIGTYFDWVITGGESGPGARPARLEWFDAIRRSCESAKVPFFHKQNGGTKKIDGTWGGKELFGKVYQEMPAV